MACGTGGYRYHLSEGSFVFYANNRPLSVDGDENFAPARHASISVAPSFGYVGDGVATSNLAGRTLRDLILGDDTELVRLAWVGHRSPRWEPEPARWLESLLIEKTMAASDASGGACSESPSTSAGANARCITRHQLAQPR